jgi:NAD(P)-dependent dehydrogenase (short-subunit alcohol dehydrogenase family)
MTQRTVIITGAGSGIGRATALAAHAAGYALVLNGRKLAALEQVAALLKPQACEIVVGDIADRSTAPRLVEAALQRFGRLDAIVNNAACGRLVPAAATTLELFESTFATNVFGAGLLIAAAWPQLCVRGGAVVNISSLAAIDPFDGFLVYGASKAALESFTRSIVREGKSAGVEAYSLRIGAVETSFLRQFFDREVFPEGKPLAPELIAELVVACISGARRQDSGEVITVATPA